jgi:hypothetical protein
VLPPPANPIPPEIQAQEIIEGLYASTEFIENALFRWAASTICISVAGKGNEG